MASRDSTRHRSDFIDLTGKTFGRWTVLAFHSQTNRISYWLCRCGCGVIKHVRGSALRTGGSLACLSCAKKRHGMEKSPEYNTWRSMCRRCLNPNAANYALYGGRGIAICQRWLIFENFFEDMGPKPSLAHSLDRINNEGNYEPGNCRWATAKEQSRNRRTNRFITHNGTTKTLVEWAENIEISAQALYRRLKQGWPNDKALTTPFIPCNKRRW